MPCGLEGSPAATVAPPLSRRPWPRGKDRLGGEAIVSLRDEEGRCPRRRGGAAKPTTAHTDGGPGPPEVEPDRLRERRQIWCTCCSGPSCETG
jgi:hypothetical protein